MTAGLPLTIVLPAAVFGPYDTGQLGRSLALLARGKLPRLPKGFGTNTWTHAADVAEGHVLVATVGRPGEEYLLGDRVLPMVDFYRKAAEAVGVSPPTANVPIGVARLAARVTEASADSPDGLLSFPARPSTSRRSISSSTHRRRARNLDGAHDPSRTAYSRRWSGMPPRSGTGRFLFR